MPGASRLSGYNVTVTPPGSGIVAYTVDIADSNLGTFYSQIWAVPSAGGTPVQLTTSVTSGDFAGDPDVSPDDSQVVYSLYTNADGDNTLWIMNADGSGQTQISSTLGSVGAMWNPAGTKIVFTDSISIYSINPDGTGQTTLFTRSSTDTVRHPAWNMDGSLIAFQVDKSSGATTDQLWVMNADGSGATQIATTHTGSAFNDGPSWAHASNVIAFVKSVSGNDRVHKINSDGSGSTQLDSSNISPALTRVAWSDDDSLIFTPRRQSPWKMFQVPAAGTVSSAVSPDLPMLNVQNQGRAWIFHSRIYTVDDNGNIVSIMFDGSDFRTDVVPDTSDPNITQTLYPGYYNG